MVDRVCVEAGFVGGRKGVGVTWDAHAEYGDFNGMSALPWLVFECC